jgi:hypothetical protein
MTTYRPHQVSQLDSSQYAGLNCTCAAGVVALDRETLGAKRTTGARVRQLAGNTVVGNPYSSDGTPRGLNTWVTLARRANIVVTNNSSSQAAIGPVLAFAHVDGLVVSGNTQPRVSGSLLLISDCTGVSIGSNP